MSSARAASLVVARPRLEALLDRTLGHRLGLVIADAGFGKTTLLTEWSADINAVLHDVTPADNDLSRLARDVAEALRRLAPDLAEDGPMPDTTGEQQARPDAIAELLGSALEQHLRRDAVLVLDNVHVLENELTTRFLGGLIRHAPPLLHIVLAGRTMPPIAVARLRDRGEVTELHGADLDFTEAEIAQLLTADLGDDARRLAKPIMAGTAGWPSAVRLAIEALHEIEPASRGAYVRSLTGEHGKITQLATTAYLNEPPQVRRLLAVVALFDEVTAELLDSIDASNAEVVQGTLRRGLFLEPGASGPAWFRLHAIAAEAVGRHGRIPDPETIALRTAAAKWFIDAGLAGHALRALRASGEHREVANTLARWGESLVNQGYAEHVIVAVDALPAELRSTRLERLAGEAHQIRGEWDQALACYARAEPTADPVDPGIAWRMGLIHYLKGELDAAIAIYQRARVGDVATRDSALLLAWQASAYWMRGDVDDCARLAVHAMRAATEVDDPQALAAAHTVLAMLAALEGDRRANDAHYRKALHFAEQAGDVLQLVRIHNNLGSHHLEEGAYEEALAELRIAITLADLSGFAAFGALALCNRGEAQRALGRLEEAQNDFQASIAVFDRLGSALVANPLQELATLHRVRGDVPAAKEKFERALRLAEDAGDAQAMAPALSGLAVLLAQDDPPRAAELAKRAVAAGTGLAMVRSLLASGWVALLAGDLELAHEQAQAAMAEAAGRRDLPALAEAATLAAASASDARQALRHAEDALALWSRAGDPIGHAGAEIVRAKLLDDAAAVAALTGVHDRMRTIGCRMLEAHTSEALAKRTRAVEQAVRVETLGGFRVVRDGTVVPASAWKSRKARDLIKILISRRGKPVTIDALMERLWPGQRPDELANRFNVLVSTVRSLLDPGRVLSPDGLLANDGEALHVETDRLAVDVEEFLADAAAGLRLITDGRHTEGIEVLRRVEARYTGDFLEEDLYADWAAPLREEARLTYRQVAEELARHARGIGDADATVRYLLRSLERDPYDERIHLELVSALSAFGRHGDARRYYRGYCGRMDELGIEAAPFPA